MAEKTINAKIDADLHQMMRRYLVEKDWTTPTFLEEAIAQYLKATKNEEGKWVQKDSQS